MKSCGMGTIDNFIRGAVEMIRLLDAIAFHADRLKLSVEVEAGWAALWGNPIVVGQEAGTLAERTEKIALELAGAMSMLLHGEYEDRIVKRSVAVSVEVDCILCRASNLISYASQIQGSLKRGEGSGHGAAMAGSTLRNAGKGFVASTGALEMLSAAVQKLRCRLTECSPESGELCVDENSAHFLQEEAGRRASAVSCPEPSKMPCGTLCELMLPDGSLLQHESFMALEDYEFVRC